MKLNYARDDSGVPYRSIGAAPYIEYLAMANEEIGNVQDWGLPTTMNDYENRFSSTEIANEGARWTSLNTHKRANDCSLEAKDICPYIWGTCTSVTTIGPTSGATSSLKMRGRRCPML